MLRVVVCSQFFQEPELWLLLKPMLAELTGDPDCPPVIWSAGCGSGKETYSAAILLDAVGARAPRLVVGTDIDDAQLDRARAGGPYALQDVRDMSPEEQARYLQAGGPPHYVVEKLRHRVEYRRHDLRTDSFPDTCSLVLYRSLETCFSDAENLSIYTRIADALRPGGLLFIGAADRGFGLQDLGLDKRAPCIYAKQ